MNGSKPGKDARLSESQVESRIETVLHNFYYKTSLENPSIVTLCGSTSFKHEYRLANRFFTINGWIVLSVGGFHHLENYTLSERQKIYVDKLHFRKIDKSDMVFVINRGGYVGESTQNEIGHAIERNIPVIYLQPEPKQ